jgi:predicted RNA-binding protein YlxR (DUF448 family)
LSETLAPADTIDAGPSGALRTCLVSGESRDKGELLRFVVDPQGEIVPDIEGSLPGRGLWLLPRRDILAAALAKRLFARAARREVSVPAGLADRVEELLARRCVDLIGLARRAGQAVTGFAKVEAALGKGLDKGGAAVLIEASEGALGGRGKLKRLAPQLPVVDALNSVELGRAFARDMAVHACLARGGLAKKFLAEAARLAGFREIRDGKNASDAENRGENQDLRIRDQHGG